MSRADGGGRPPVRWGFLGAGRMGGILAGAVGGADGAVLVAVGARDPARARSLAGSHGAPSAYGGYHEVIEDPDVDAVYVALTHDMHEPWTTAALAAGKAVLCEKPLALSAIEVDTMIAAAQLSDRVLVEASLYRWSPRVRLAQELLAADEIGPVRHVAGGFTFGRPPAGDFRWDPARGGGALYDVGCYPVSAALWAVGRGLPTEVTARSRFGPTGVDLASDVLLRWPGCDGEIRAAIDDRAAQWLVITGERGQIELREQSFTAGLADDVELWVSDGRTTRRIPVPPADPYRIMVEEVSSVLRGGPGWVLPPAESRLTSAVLDACFVSAREGGKPVRPG